MAQEKKLQISATNFAAFGLLSLALAIGCKRAQAPAQTLKPAQIQPPVSVSPQPAPGTADGALPPVLGPVELQPQPDVLEGAVDAYPRVLPGPAVTPEVAAKINAALAHDEALAKAAALECRADLKQQQPQDKPDDLADAWQRSVDVTMRGPRFLSYTLGTSIYCGSAYPDLARSSSIVFDLNTGKPVSWDKLLPRGTRATRGYLDDGAIAGWLTVPSIQRLVYKDAEPDCKEVFDRASTLVPFEVYPDARDGTLVLNTPDIMHARRECEVAWSLKLADLNKLGAPPEVWQAISAAYALQPKH